MASLDEILSDKPAEKPAEAPQKEPAAAEAAPEAPPAERASSVRAKHRAVEFAAQGRDPETGKFIKAEDAPKEAPKKEEAPKAEAKKEEKAPAAPPTQEMSAKEKAAFAAAADERRKRQQLEQRLAALEQQRQQAPADPNAKPKTFWDDPEGHLKAFQQQMAGEAIKIRMNTSEDIARSKYPDFEEKVAEFQALVQSTPGLAERWIQSQNPAEFAYRTAKHHMEMQNFGSLEEWKAAQTAQIRAELEAQLAQKAQEQAAKVAAIPPSLSQARGGGNKTAPAWQGPKTLEEILKG